MCSEMMSVLQGLIPELISSQECHVKMGPLLSGYGGMGI